MADPRKVLTREDYSNYRNVRAVSVLFIILGSILVLGGLGSAFDEKKGSPNDLPFAFNIVIAIAGFAGAVGGIAVLRGSRRWAPIIYGMAALYILAFPIGTILSFIMFKGLSRYLNSVDEVRAQANVRDVF